MAEQQYYVYIGSDMVTASWQPYVKNYAPTLTFDYGIVLRPCGWSGSRRGATQGGDDLGSTT
jgi:hypothetical protein